MLVEMSGLYRPPRPASTRFAKEMTNQAATLKIAIG
jgi:hypothetical protein